jgi:chromosome segregation ATPase
MADFITVKDFEKFTKQNDGRFAEYGRRIAEFEFLREEVKGLHAAVLSTNQAIEKLNTSLLELGKEAKAKDVEYRGYQELVSEKFEAAKANVDNIKKALEQAKLGLSDANASHRSNVEKIAQIGLQLTSLTSLKSGLDAFQEDVRLFKQLASTQIENSKTNIQKFLSEISNLKSDLVKALEFKTVYESDRSEFKVSLQKIQELIVAYRANASAAIDSQLGALKKEFTEKINSIHIPEVKESVPESRVAKIESQLEGIALDAKNAFLKSSNVDMQSQLNSKKIENIQLLLKQHELTK